MGRVEVRRARQQAERARNQQNQTETEDEDRGTPRSQRGPTLQERRQIREGVIPADPAPDPVNNAPSDAFERKQELLDPSRPFSVVPSANRQGPPDPVERRNQAEAFLRLQDVDPKTYPDFGEAQALADEATTEISETERRYAQQRAARVAEQIAPGRRLIGDARDFAERGIDFEPNVLSGVDNPTYHFRLSAVNELNALNPAFLGSNIRNLRRTTIAETGATEFFINEVEIESFTGWSPNFRNQGATGFDIKIMEPQGVKFMDAAFNATVNEGNMNWLKAPYLLELWFLGHDPNTGQLAKIPGSTWSWLIYIQSQEFEVNEGGSQYTFRGVPFEQRAYAADMNITDLTFDTKIRTVGQFFQKLAEHLNEEEEKHSLFQNEPLPKAEYNFEILNQNIPGIAKPMKDWEITPKDKETNSSRKSPFEVVENDEGTKVTQVTFNKGIDLPRVLELVLANTVEGVKAVAGTKDDDSLDQRDTSLPYKWVPTMEPQLRYTNYIRNAADWDKQITYFIFLKQEPSQITSQEEKKLLEQKGFQKNRIIRLNEEGTLRKRYDYIFTGRNTEVLNFDIKFNTLWSVPQNWFSGAWTYERFSVGEKVDPKALEELKTEAEERKVVRDLTSGRFSDANTPNIPAAAWQVEQARLQAFEDATGRSPNINDPNSIESGLIQTRDQRVALRNAELEQNASRIARRDRTQRFSDELGDNESTLSDINRKVLISTKHADYNPRADMDSGIEANWRKGKSIFASALHQIYGMHGDLQSIELEIRGDPYWLGRENTRKYAGEWIEEPNGTGQTQTVSRPDYSFSIFQFLLLFGFPDRIEERNRPAQIKEHEFTSAVYNVDRITSTFKNGQFTQTLQAHRDIKTDIRKIDKSILKA